MLSFEFLPVVNNNSLSDVCFEKFGYEKESTLPNGVEKLWDFHFISYLF